MNEVIQTIITRRSCKAYRPDPVPPELVEQVVQAGLYAPSGMNRQPVIILSVSRKEVRDQLSRLNAKYDSRRRPDPFYGAPVVLAVLAKRDVATAVNDGSLAMGNMLLAAHSLGLGSCWIHRAKEVFEDPEALELLKSLGVEGEYLGIAHCVLGYPEAENHTIPPRKENRVFRVD